MMSHIENEKHLEMMQQEFDESLEAKKYSKCEEIVKLLREEGFTGEAMYLWEELYKARNSKK